MVAVLEMTERSGPSQSSRDRILWILTNSDGKKEHAGRHSILSEGVALWINWKIIKH
jgi:hypothetical protein